MDRRDVRELRSADISEVASAVDRALVSADVNVRDEALKLCVFIATKNLPQVPPECTRIFGVPFHPAETPESTPTWTGEHWDHICSVIMEASRDSRRRVRRRALVSLARCFFDQADVQHRISETILDESEVRYVRGNLMMTYFLHNTIPVAAIASLERFMKEARLRPAVLQVLLGKPITAEIKALLMRYVTHGSRDEAVAATRALSGRPIRSLGAVRRQDRGKQPIDHLVNEFVTLENQTPRLWAGQESSNSSATYMIAGWTIDPSANVMVSSEGEIHVQPRTMAVLNELVKSRGRVVTKEELLASVWRGRVVGDDAVHRRISDLRRIFGDSRDSAKVIQTVTTSGYRLVAEINGDLPDRSD